MLLMVLLFLSINSATTVLTNEHTFGTEVLTAVPYMLQLEANYLRDIDRRRLESELNENQHGKPENQEHYDFIVGKFHIFFNEHGKFKRSFDSESYKNLIKYINVKSWNSLPRTWSLDEIKDFKLVIYMNNWFLRKILCGLRKLKFDVWENSIEF